MDFWTPTKGPWSEDLNDTHMPFYCKYNYVKIEKYNEKTGEFENYHRDDFDSLDENFWIVSDGWGSGSQTSSIYKKSQVYIEKGNLVFKMEHDPKFADVKPEVEVEPETDLDVNENPEEPTMI